MSVSGERYGKELSSTDTAAAGIDFPSLPTFEPARWARGGHHQTVLAAYFPGRLAPYSAIAHRLTLDDGDQLVIHDDCPSSWSHGNRAVVLMHGVAGCHRSPYLVRLVQKLGVRGVRCFRIDQRGCGAGAGLARHPGHAGRSEDLEVALRFIAQRCPAAPMTLIGFSLGANVLLKYLGEAASGVVASVQKAIAVAPPVDLRRCSDNIHAGWNRMYDRVFAKELARRVATWPGDAWTSRWTRPPRTLRDFDSQFTAPCSGFRSVDEYYETCSSGPLLKHIHLPTILLAAADDPLVPLTTITETDRSNWVKLQITNNGGHLGYLGVTGVDPDRRWLDWRLVELVTRWEPVR